MEIEDLSRASQLDHPYELEGEANQDALSVLLPADLTNLDPAWQSCVLGVLEMLERTWERTFLDRCGQQARYCPRQRAMTLHR